MNCSFLILIFISILILILITLVTDFIPQYLTLDSSYNGLFYINELRLPVSQCLLMLKLMERQVCLVSNFHIYTQHWSFKSFLLRKSCNYAHYALRSAHSYVIY